MRLTGDRPGSILNTDPSTMKSRRAIPARTRLFTRLLTLFALVLPFTARSADPAARPASKGAGMDLIGTMIFEMDRNADRRVDRREFDTGTLEGFQEMDADRDGRIVGAEIDALGNRMAETLGIGAVAAKAGTALMHFVLMTMDKDSDRALSRDEYLAGSQAVFGKLDADADGSVDAPEVSQLPLRLLGIKPWK